MAKSKETIYWSTVVLYTVLLTAILLYLRFPAEKFRLFVENTVERHLEGIRCSIEEIVLAYPVRLQLANVRLNGLPEGEEPLLIAEGISVAPVWSDPFRRAAISISAYGGRHSLVAAALNNRLLLDEVVVEEVDLTRLASLWRQIDRNVTGILSVRGEAVFAMESFELESAAGTADLRDGLMELKRPLLEMETLAIEHCQAALEINDQTLAITEGKLENDSIGALFTGRITLADPLALGEVQIEGTMTPRPPLYRQNRQLQVIVSRMQQRYGGEELPFVIGGTVGRPTFVFGGQ